ncbi:hypothetical protein JCM3774_003697 [Rhodotorula dairenensis]
MGRGVRNAHAKGKVYGGAGKARDRTRAEKPKLIEDPELEEKVLSAQLREAGLYAANILGDGNCLFRALADQLYGSPSMHLAIRHEICDYLAVNADRYRLFVDEDSVKGGFDGHVREMRQPGTYGTNIELSAFVARYRRPVKVYQPNLVYVMPVEEAGPSTSTPPSSSASPAPPFGDDAASAGDKLTPRERRMLARAEKAKAKGDRQAAAAVVGRKKGKERAWHAPTPPEPQDAHSEDTPLCIVYHSWEHYSSLRNIDGPHTGPPRLRVNRVATSRANTPSAISPGDDHPSNESGNDDAEELEEEEEEGAPMAEVQDPPPPEAPPSPRRTRRPRQADDATDHPLPSMRKALERALSAHPPVSSSSSSPPQPVIPVIPPSPRPTSPSSPPSAGALSPVSSSDRPPKHLLDRSRPRSNSDASSSSRLAAQPSSDPPAAGTLDGSSSNLDDGFDENDNENELPRTRSRLNSPASWSSSGSSTGVASSLDSGLSSSSDATSPAPADKESTTVRVPPPPPSTARTARKGKSIPAQRVRRGPTAREKKELARQRRVDRRKARGLNAQPSIGSDRVLRSKVHAGSTAPDAGLGKVRELYI